MFWSQFPVWAQLIDPGLSKLLTDGGSVVAVIFVVIIFLKQRDKDNEAMQNMATLYQQKMLEAQKNFQDQIEKVHGNIVVFVDGHYKNQAAITASLESVAERLENIETSLRDKK